MEFYLLLRVTSFQSYFVKYTHILSVSYGVCINNILYNLNFMYSMVYIEWIHLVKLPISVLCRPASPVLHLSDIY
jgi:hypothetical protein